MTGTLRFYRKPGGRQPVPTTLNKSLAPTARLFSADIRREWLMKHSRPSSGRTTRTASRASRIAH